MNKKGFVLIETVVVISVISITLVMLFSSYSYILTKSKERVLFDTTETIYKTYYLKKEIDNLKPIGEVADSIDYFIDTHKVENGSICKSMGKYNSYECDLTKSDSELTSFRYSFEIEKFYVLNPKEVLKSIESEEWLNLFDATTIDYIKELGPSNDKRLIVVKYKKTYGRTDGTYEIFHSSTETDTSKKNTNTIYFSANGGVLEKDNYDYTINQPFNTLPIPTKEGFTFSGWYTANVGGTKIEETTINNLDNNTTLYARWKEN